VLPGVSICFQLFPAVPGAGPRKGEALTVLSDPDRT
jgi:hypothetical protein